MKAYAGLVRLGWGAVLVGLPRQVLEAAHAPTTGRTVLVARVLGVRQVLQGGLTLLLPDGWTARPCAVVDGLHATSAVALAVVSRRWRRVGFADALLASSFLVLEVMEASRTDITTTILGGTR